MKLSNSFKFTVSCSHTLFSWLKPLPPMLEILRSGRMGEVFSFPLQNPPSLFSLLNSPLIRYLFMYAAPIWFPNSSPSLIQKLQIIQNSSLRIATGYGKMTSIDHLHEGTKMLAVQDHLSLISSQYLAKAIQPKNPSHSVHPSGKKLTSLAPTGLPFSNSVYPFVAPSILIVKG